MASPISSRFRNAWNAFLNKDPTTVPYNLNGSSYRPDKNVIRRGHTTMINAIYNRIALDVASVDIKHVRLDQNGRYKEDMNSGLNNCLTVEANIDQTGREWIKELVRGMLLDGYVAGVPTRTTKNPHYTDSYDILQLRVGKILEWYPSSVKVQVYNEDTGQKEELIFPKRFVSIIENPFYAVMNEPNSDLQRLLRKLALMDMIDDQNSSGKLDLIIQLPFSLRTEKKRREAEERRAQIENQLTGSKYGIAYIDTSEHVTQLNRGVENNLLAQVEYLTRMLYSHLNITEEIMNGTADDATMLNYNNRTIEVFLSAIVEEMRRKFLTSTARTQGQSIVFFKDPFKLVPVSQISEIADKFTRNEIMTSNEIRQVIGMKPSDDPNADVLLNKNINHPEEKEKDEPLITINEEENQNEQKTRL